MEKMMSCCGVVCGECEYYPEGCGGCDKIKGQVFWLEYTKGTVCEIYDCCMNKKRYHNCGECEELPCGFYDLQDPTKTEEENEKGLRQQLINLRGYEYDGSEN